MWHVWELEEAYTGFEWEDLRVRDYLENLDVDERTILKRIFNKKEWGSMDWDDLGQDRERWRELVNFIKELLDFIKCGKLLDWHKIC
jgi:hypothetical protein